MWLFVRLEEDGLYDEVEDLVEELDLLDEVLDELDLLPFAPYASTKLNSSHKRRSPITNFDNPILQLLV
ncbi:MAG: hypothetical protein V2I33_22910 [Kangiellaceae bacterium]|nr:hypothetical protein [Kangiellaceae bacterium]